MRSFAIAFVICALFTGIIAAQEPTARLLGTITDPTGAEIPGATLGGPIKPDKIFFFVDYKGARTRQGTTMNSTIPTPRQLTGNYTGGRPLFDPLTTRVNPANASQFIRDQFPNNVIAASRIAAQALYFKSWFPAPDNGPTQFVYSPALSLDTNKFDVKISPRLTAKDSLVSGIPMSPTKNRTPRHFRF